MKHVYRLIAGVDIGNSTTEVCIAAKTDTGNLKFLASAVNTTTGIKGTADNVSGILEALDEACSKAGITAGQLSSIRINEAAPVISDIAMETISETMIIESSMIGHNPATPGGIGLGVGNTVAVESLLKQQKSSDLIVVVPKSYDFEDAAGVINKGFEMGLNITGAIVQKDDAVLINNRLTRRIPVVDEVELIDKVPLGKLAAVEVANNGETIKVLSNPYGLATIFGLSPNETKNIIPISRSLIGNRSAVVIKTPHGDVRSNRIAAGTLTFIGKDGSREIDVMSGADKIMEAAGSVGIIEDVLGEANTEAGSMLHRVREVMAGLTQQQSESMKIQDVLAIDTFVPVKVNGGLAGEYALENAVLIAAMVKTSKLPMQKIADELSDKTGVFVKIAGAEANMALLGALTTPGTEKPVAIVDIGGGSTDAALITGDGVVKSVHLAGAGDLVTKLINSELALNDLELAEAIKKYPLAKVESPLYLRFEDGTVKYCETPLDPGLFARIVVITDSLLIPIKTARQLSIEKIRLVRQEAKKKVFAANTIRALKAVSPDNNLRSIDFVVMVGGSALDFEIPEIITQILANYNVVAGRGNIRGMEGPRNAVATGLVLSEIRND
ncbi:MAG: Diol/glycerol dehydratase reactivating factor large subunit [Eubacterium sp.]|jgi:diol dehydratase reactivase alpha subunit|nr:Diol/glycerol dehydratase reactivating factor large subunit [Eubacterium sp.]